MTDTMRHIEEWEPFIGKLAHKYANTICSEEDLVQQGIVGVLRALREHTEQRGCLRTFIYVCIQTEIIVNALENAYPVYVPAGTALTKKDLRDEFLELKKDALILDTPEHRENLGYKDDFQERIEVKDLISKTHSDVAELFFIERLTYREICERTGMAYQKVMKVVKMLREQLKNLMEK